MQIPFSNGKEESEYLKTKWIHSQKEERVLINNVSLYYSKKESQHLISSTIMRPAWKKQSMISIQKLDK